MRGSLRIFALAGALLCLAAPPASAVSWSWPGEYADDATQPDPDTHGNPSVWSYLYADAADFDGTYSALTRDGGTGRWVGPTSGFPIVDGWLHPTTSPDPSMDAIVAWRSPVAGWIDLSGSFQDGDTSTGDGVHVYIHHGTTSLFDQILGNAGAPATFTLSRNVAVGDFFFFRVNARSTPNADATYLPMTISEQAPAVPEPGSLALVASGVAVAAGVGRRRLRAPRRGLLTLAASALALLLAGTPAGAVTMTFNFDSR